MLGIAVLSRDALGELQPRFGDEEKAGFVGEGGGPFRQIKARSGEPPVLEFQTHWRTQSTFKTGKLAVEFEKTQKQLRGSPPANLTVREKFSPKMT